LWNRKKLLQDKSGGVRGHLRGGGCNSSDDSVICPNNVSAVLSSAHQQCVFGWFLRSMRDFCEEGRVPFEDQIWNGDDVEGEEESGIPGPDYMQLLEEVFGSLYGEDESDSTLVDDQAVSIGESQIIE